MKYIRQKSVKYSKIEQNIITKIAVDLNIPTRRHTRIEYERNTAQSLLTLTGSFVRD